MKYRKILIKYNVYLQKVYFTCANISCISRVALDVLCLEVILMYIVELVHEISNNVACATSKASDQPAHKRSLIRAFASRLSIL